jgi:hypothetical protein
MEENMNIILGIAGGMAWYVSGALSGKNESASWTAVILGGVLIGIAISIHC